jgi:hypothetical protein
MNGRTGHHLLTLTLPVKGQFNLARHGFYERQTDLYF